MEKFIRMSKEYSFISSYLKNNKRIALDIGACIGDFTKQFSRDFQHVHAFEPVSTTFKMLSESLSNYDNVTLHNNAVGESLKQIEITNLQGHYGRNMVQNNRGKAWLQKRVTDRKLKKEQWSIESVEQVVIDDFNFTNVDLVKIDVEDYEYEVLLGMTEFFENNSPACFIEVHDNSSNKDKIFQYFQKINYDYKKYNNLNHIFFKK